jgi:hypothetical protein
VKISAGLTQVSPQSMEQITVITAPGLAKAKLLVQFVDGGRTQLVGA